MQNDNNFMNDGFHKLHFSAMVEPKPKEISEFSPRNPRFNALNVRLTAITLINPAVILGG